MLLNLHSYFSLRYGTISLDDLTDLIISHGHDTAVLTDINNSSAIFPFIKKCREKGINGLVGMEYRNGDTLLYIGIARNEAGFAELNEHMTTANRNKQPLPEFAPEFNQVFIVYPLGAIEIRRLRENEFIGIRPDQINKISLEPRSNFDRYVILWPVTVKNESDYQLHQQLRAVDRNLIYSKVTKSMVANSWEKMPERKDMINKFYRFPEILVATEKLLSQCSFNFDFTIVRNKKYFTGNAYDDKLLLEKLAVSGMQRRYGNNNKEAKQRVAKELRIIDELCFSAYFLITHDIIRYTTSG